VGITQQKITTSNPQSTTLDWFFQQPWPPCETDSTYSYEVWRDDTLLLRNITQWSRTCGALKWFSRTAIHSTAFSEKWFEPLWKKWFITIPTCIIL